MKQGNKQANIVSSSFLRLILSVVVVNGAMAPAVHAADDVPVAQDRKTTRVYQCIRDGQRILSDQVCGADAQARDVEVANRMQPTEIPHGKTDSKSDSAPVRKRVRVADAGDDARARCVKLARDKRSIDERMRTGYSGAQGERMRERLRKINDEYFERRCSRFG